MVDRSVGVAVSPTTAFELLMLLLERDGDAMEQCGDDHWSVQMKLETAAELAPRRSPFQVTTPDKHWSGSSRRIDTARAQR